MAIYRLLENSAFDPGKVRIMVEAYECACRELDLAGNKTDQITELIARKIVEIAQAEVEMDAQVICDRSWKSWGSRDTRR